MNIVLLLANAAMVLAVAVFVLSLVKLRTLPAYLLAAFIVAYADVVLILELAGLAEALNRPLVLTLQALFTACSVSLWIRNGRPLLFAPFTAVRAIKLPHDRESILKGILLAIVAALVGYVYLRHALLILEVRPDNYDALTYHLSRVGYWLQYESFLPWSTPNLRQTTFPMNAELGVLWTVLWWGTDQLSGFVQWIAVPAIMIGIYGLVRLLGYSRWQGLISGLLWSTLIQVLNQSSTTQNDLVTTSFWIACIYFFFAGMRERDKTRLYLSGLSFGLAIGTKFTSMIFLPGFVVAVLVSAWLHRREAGFRISLVQWGIACLMGAAIWGSYSYVQNVAVFGNPLGPAVRRTASAALLKEVDSVTRAVRLRDNLGRYTYQFIDFSGLPLGAAARINPLKAAVFSALFDRLGMAVEDPATVAYGGFSFRSINPLDENNSWFGPLAIFLIPAAALQMYKGGRNRDGLRLALPIMGLGFLVIQSALQVWSPVKGRYFMVPVAACFPLLAGLLSTRTVWRAALACLLVLLGLITMLSVTWSGEKLRRLGWSELLESRRRAPSSENEFNYRLIAGLIPEEASIGLQSSDDLRDYPFFGERFTHYLTLAAPNEELMLPRTDLRRFVTDFENSDYLFLTRAGSPETRAMALQEFSLLSDDGANSLWIRQQHRSADTCDGDQWPFADLVQSSTAAICPRFPIYPGLTAGGASRTIFLRDGRLVPTIAAGSQGELGFDLLVTESLEVVISIDVVPRNLQKDQMLLLSLSSADAPVQAHSETFSGKSVLKFSLHLVRGAYELRLRMAPGSSEASVLKIEVAAP